MVLDSKKLRTPFYRIKEKELVKDIRLLESSLEKNWGNFVMGYSVKTNSLPWLLSFLHSYGFYAEVVSGLEYDLAKRLGYSDNRIIYNGPIKEKKIWENVLLGGGIVNFDSSNELDWIEELSGRNSDKTFKVGLRINCDIAKLCPNEQLAHENGGRFGYCYENGVLEDAIYRVKKLKNVNIAGVHLHSSTKSRSVEVYGALAKMAIQIANEYSLDLSYIDMGGGYFGGRDDMPSYPDYFAEIGSVLSTYFDKNKTALVVEPGVSLVSRASTFETEVLDIKDIRNTRYIVTNGSRVNLNPQVTRHFYPHHFEYLDENERDIEKTQWICGSTCMEYDRLFEIEEGKALKIGDRIIYETAGGYTMCLSPLFINYFPAVYIEKEDGSIFVAREEWENDEYLQKYHW